MGDEDEDPEAPNEEKRKADPAPPKEVIPVQPEHGIELFGDEVNNNPTGPLQECEGDCDRDTTCGGCLTCYQFDSVTATPPEGCYGDIFNHPKFGVYDYYGECDLVLIDNPSFENGLGLRLHIRTTRV